MKKATIISFLLLFVGTLGFGLGVDVEELAGVGKKIEFESFTGISLFYNTDLDIRGIGVDLAGRVKSGESTARYQNRYSALHLVDGGEPGKLNADVIIVEKDARVDHVDNIRRILSGYLETLYGYPRKDADVLAVFLTYYNAVYRGNLEFLNTKYKTWVMKELDQARVGLAVRYSEWPGATQIVIPLNENEIRDVLGSLSTTELTGKPVVDKLKEQPDKGVDERKAIVEVKEKEVATGKEKVAEEKAKVEEKKKEVAVDKAAIEKDKAAIAEKKSDIAKKTEEVKKEAAQASKAPATTPEEAAAKAKKENETAAKAEALAREKARVAAEEAAVKEKESGLAKKQQETADAEKGAKEKEAAVAAKEKEVASDRKEIARDETAAKIETKPDEVKQELAKKSEELAAREEELAKREAEAKKTTTDANIFANVLYYLKVKEYLTDGHYNNDLIAINALTGKKLSVSPVTGICGKFYYAFKDGVVVISHKGAHTEGHFLTLLDLKTLETKSIGEDVVFWRSFVEVREDQIYVVLENGGKYYLGKFASDLKRIAISQEPVSRESFISFYADLVYINGENGNILVLNKEDLTVKESIAP